MLRVNDASGIISIPNVADLALFNTLIGSYSVDLMSVYKNQHHEYWRKWGILYNSMEADDVDQQGQIKFSVSVLGPNDSQLMHDPSKQVEDENEEDEDADIGNRIQYTCMYMYLCMCMYISTTCIYSNAVRFIPLLSRDAFNHHNHTYIYTHECIHR